MLADGGEGDIRRTSSINFNGAVGAVLIIIFGHNSNVLWSINEVENCKNKHSWFR